LEQLSADLSEQHDFPSLLSAVEDFEEQHDADFPSLDFPLLSAEDFDEQHDAPSFPFALSPLLLVDLLSAFAAFPPRATLFADEPASLVCATSDEVVFAAELASVCALAAKAKNAKTLKISTFFMKQFFWLMAQKWSSV